MDWRRQWFNCCTSKFNPGHDNVEAVLFGDIVASRNSNAGIPWVGLNASIPYTYTIIYIYIYNYIYIHIYIYSSPVWGHCMDKECLNIFTHLPSVEEWSVNLWIFVRADVPKLSHSGLIRWMKLSIHLGLKDIYHTVQCLRRGMWGLRLLAGTIRNLQIILNIHYIIFHYINT